LICEISQVGPRDLLAAVARCGHRNRRYGGRVPENAILGRAEGGCFGNTDSSGRKLFSFFSEFWSSFAVRLALFH
jgi:hypothetical protein